MPHTSPSRSSLEIPSDAVTVDGKHFALRGERFPFKGVTYGTFGPREDGAHFPEREVIKQDFASMNEAGFTVVRTYTEPTDDLLELAADWDLRVLAGVELADWRHQLPGSRREVRRMMSEAEERVRHQTRRLSGDPQVLALVLGNEIPADVVRWVGTKQVTGFIRRLAGVVGEEDPHRLVTYANYPTTEYLLLDDLDFVMFNVFLEQPDDFRRYLTRLHHLVGDRPLVLGEIGAHTGSSQDDEARQAEMIDWQLAIALERGTAGHCLFAWTDEWHVEQPVEGWQFGLTRADRSPRPALDVAGRWNHRSVADLTDRWPAISVVICAYNAAATIDECLRHTCALDYPDLEVLVVDDGSTDATAAITRRHPRARLISVPHGGLSVARNEGYRAATGELVAYLDSDAYPTPEWPYYLVLGLDSDRLGGVGGPNVPPPDDGPGAQQVAQAPGGPVHVLVNDNRAEHVPGCNMAFWKGVLTEVGGCDPVYEAAGDDVDLCWKVLDRGYEIGFHPAALVWHHRRTGLRTYLRQQRGYGKAEALVEARHPDRFTPAGTARWKGRIYGSLAPSLGRQRVYRGIYGSAAYQSVYGEAGHAVDLAHQVGMPLSAVAVATAPAMLLNPMLVLPAVVALAFVATLFALDFGRARLPHRSRRAGTRIRFRAGVAAMHLFQPLWRTWGRLRHTKPARRELPAPATLPGPVVAARAGTLVLPLSRPRAELAADLVTVLRRGGVRVLAASGWEDHDARFHGSWLLAGELITSAHPRDCVTIRIRRRVRRQALPGTFVATLAAMAMPALLVPIGVAVGADLFRGWWRTGRRPRALVHAAIREDDHHG